MVALPDNRTFLLYHAYDPAGFQYTGRQGLLDEVTWGADGWPAINGGPVAITPAQMGYLLEAIDWRNPQHTWRPASAG